MVAGKPQRRTLQRNSQFRTCYAHGKKAVCGHIVIFYLPVRSEDGGVSFGVVASKRVGDAVRRNRAKRLLRVAARSVEDRLNNRNIWMVLVAKGTITAQSSRIVQDDLERGLAKAGLLD